MRQRIAGAACAVLILGGCTATTTSESTEAVPLEVSSGPATLTAEPGDKPAGRFYAVIGGETSSDNRLYQLSFIPPSLQLLTDTSRISSVSACRDKVVVAAGQAEVGFSDHLQEVRDGALAPLEGFGVQPGFTPELDDRCRLAYTWVDRNSESSEFELRVWDAGAKGARTLYRSQSGDGPLVNPDWGPDGKLAVVRQAADAASPSSQGSSGGRPPAVIIVRPDGSSSELGGTGNVVGLAWSKRWLAVMDDPEGTVFVDAAGVRGKTLPGWYPLAWSPDGDQLLVQDAETRRILAVVHTGDIGTAKPIGRVSGPVWDVDWLPA